MVRPSGILAVLNSSRDFESQRIPDLFPIEFVVVGGGAGGLTSAIALGRCGHKVTVLDDTPSYESVSAFSCPLHSTPISPSSLRPI